MALGNTNSVSQARGKNVAIKVRKEKQRVIARDEDEGGRGGREGGGR